MVFHCELSDRSLMHYFNDGALSKKYSVKHLHSAKFPLRWIGGWPQHYSDVASSCWSQLEALDSRVYQSELHIVEGRAIVELLENLRELAQATAPFLCETQVGTLRCHC